ncbi:MAG: response regulator [Elusimicrobia bacterium]|nr:response regulator [Elusimicrobiota bacterium]
MDKILVYDADPRFREVMKGALASLGYEAVIAADGYTVLPLAEQHRPRLFVLDYKLPEADGFEILKRLRAAPAFALAPVIFASVTPKFEIEMTILDAPAVGYIDKPLDVKQLKGAIEALIGPLVKAAAAPAAQPPMMDIPPPGAPLSAPVFNGEPDLDGVRDDVIDLD